jgi:hypothetical protein
VAVKARTRRPLGRVRLAAVASVLVLGLFGVGTASAATLGVTAHGTDVAAGAAPVTVVDTGCGATATMRVGAVQFDKDRFLFATTAVVISNIDPACIGRSVSVKGVQQDGTSVFTVAGTATSATTTLALAKAVDAQLVTALVATFA